MAKSITRDTVLGIVGSLSLIYVFNTLIGINSYLENIDITTLLNNSGAQILFEIPLIVLWLTAPLMMTIYRTNGHRSNLRNSIYALAIVTLIYSLVEVFSESIFGVIGNEVFPYHSFFLILALPAIFLMHGYISETRSKEDAYYYTSITVAAAVSLLYVVGTILSTASFGALIFTPIIPLLILTSSIVVIGMIGSKGDFSTAKKGFIYLGAAVLSSNIAYATVFNLMAGGADGIGVAFANLVSLISLGFIAAVLLIWSLYRYRNTGQDTVI